MHAAPDTAPAAARGPWLPHLDAELLHPPDVEDGADEVPLAARLRHAAEREATKADTPRLTSARRRKTYRARGRIAQRGGGGAVGAPMRRRARRPIEAPGRAAPNRSGDGAPASPR